MKDFKLSESIERWLSKQCHNNPWIILTVFQSYKLLLSFLFTHTHTHKISKAACWSQKPSNANRAAHWRHSWPQSGLEVGLWSVNGWAQVDVWRRKGIYRPNKFTKKKKTNVFLQEHHWDYRDFFFLLLFCSQRAKDVTLQSFNPREMTKGHEAAAVLWANINPDAESMIGVLVLAVWCRCC